MLAARHVASALQDALSGGAVATFMASGGSSPEPAYRALSDTRLDWKRVSVGLVDERWVAPEHPASNERLVRASLLQGEAAAARFVPMKTPGDDPFAALAGCERIYASSFRSISCILLGMGPDGHTASWFPSAVGLDAALDTDRPELLAAIDASSSPVAGDHPLRMTLTARAVSSAGSGVLLIFGDDKREVLERSLAGDPHLYPVRAALDGLGARLTIIWAE